jgi:threonine dehydrogenase-like Zn-dependent dehydrogenase
LTRTRGRLIVAGHHDGLRSVDMGLWNERGLDVVSAHERDPAAAVAAIRSAVDAELGGLLDCRPLYTHRFRLSDLSLAFETARKRPDGFLKALVLP